MKRLIMTLLLIFATLHFIMAETRTVTLKFIETSDVHGCFFPYDFINRIETDGSLSRVSTYVKGLRAEYGDNVILLDNGDILQGQPISYFYNYVKTEDRNIAADVLNYMKYDAACIGNHDIETGHDIYDKWIEELNCPVLGANIIRKDTGRPYANPYTILERNGVRVAILGMLTPAIPNWLKPRLWNGMHFEDIVKSSKSWIDYLKANENPDIIVGLFHSGWDGGIITDDYTEDAARRVAREVPGFDIIFFGHDHKPHNSIEESIGNGKVTCLNPANNAMNVAEATVTLYIKNGKVENKIVNGKLTNVRNIPADKAMTVFFKPQTDAVETFACKQIGTLKRSIYTRDSYFGSSAFNDLIHNLQLQITEADISISAPLSFDASINEGPITVADMFNLYKYENQLYIMRLTGEEIRKHLEMSYSLWTNTMKSVDDHLLLLNEETKDDAQRLGFKNFSFNFDSAAGIDYEVDVTKPYGEKVRITRMSDGEPFDEKRWYKVAVNSYRGNGGGELLTKGAGIPCDSLASRIIWESGHDQRYYLMKEIERQGSIDPRPNNNWHFVPEAWTIPAAERDRKLLFK